jgi:hypothetical protein
MIRGIIKSRYLPIAVLVIAQLSVTLHASEHGVGQHAHDGVPCLYGLTNDDDVLAPPPSVPTPQLVSFSSSCPISSGTVESADCGFLLPPATGPPISY